MTNLQPVISLRRICKTYLDGVATPVLFEVDLNVSPGEFVAVVGASGSGKTTLLNLIGLLDTPSSGEVILGGNDVGQLTDDRRTALRRDYIGFIFQFHYLLPQFTVLENVLMPSRLKGKYAEQSQAERMTGLLDLGDGSPVVSVKSEKVDRKNPVKGKFAETIHSFTKPGHYIVRVERSDEAGIKAIAHLHVVVNE